MEPGDRKHFAALRDSNLKTARAWALKEAMMAFFEYVLRAAGVETLPLVAWLAVRSRLDPMIKKARDAAAPF